MSAFGGKADIDTCASTIYERKFSLSGEKSRLIPSYRDHPSTRSSFNILPILVVYFPVKFAQLEDTMRHLGWLFAIAVAVLVIQSGKNTDFCGRGFDGHDAHFNDAPARRSEHAGNGDGQSVLKVSLEYCSSTEAATISGLSIFKRPKAHVCFWHKADITWCTAHVRF